MNESYTQTILKAISKALNSGRNDVFLVIVSIAVVIILFFIFSLILKSGNKRNIKKTASSAYDKLIREFNLSILEIDLVDELAKALLDPDKKYLILKNKGTFRYAVQQMEWLREEKMDVIESLRSKLGFSSGPKLENGHSTKVLKAGLPVKLETSLNKVLAAEVHSISESNIIIKYFTNDDKITIGEAVNLLICSFNGFKVYNLKVVNVKDNLFSAHHAAAGNIEKKKINLKVAVENERGDHIEMRKTTVVLISEKGAIMRNTPNRFRLGDDIRIYFDNDKKRLRHVNAEVIKAPITSKFVSVRFTHIGS